MNAPLTSIVILTRNGLDLTKACIESIRACTDEPYELVLVDNGSSDGTVEFVRSLPDAVVIENDRNLGFGAGCNQGIAASGGERVLLLNNDVVVTPGWLTALHAALDSDAAVGMAGPRSNRVAGMQQVDDVDYDTVSLSGMQSWAERWCHAHRGEHTESDRIIGFCMLVKREVIEQIGGFDLRFGLGNLEDDDLCLRTRVAGWRIVVAHDCWIHHVGSQTFVREGIDYRANIEANWSMFAATWQLQPNEVDQATGSYAPAPVIARTSFDAARHHAPLIASNERQDRIDIAAPRATVLSVCCDRWDLDTTRRSLTEVLQALGPDDDVTVAVRIDPRDAQSVELLDQVADAVGDDHLPDITIVAMPDDNDLALLQTADAVYVSGPAGWARAALARHVGTSVVGREQLASLAARAAAA